MKTGLVMEGGAMRGLFTAGVIDVWMEQGVEFDGAIGVSAGAAFGCNYPTRQPRRVIRYNVRFAHEKRFCSIRSWLKTGDLYGAEFCYHIMPNRLDYWDVETLKKNPMEFYCVCTEVSTGAPVYHKCTDGGYADLEWIRASASMPIFSRPVHVDGHVLLDGGISDSIPLSYFQRIGYDRNVVILTQPKSYRKTDGKMDFLIQAALRRYPQIARDMKYRTWAYNHQLQYVREQEARGNTLVICPPRELKIGKIEHDTEVMKKVYKIGRKTGWHYLHQVKKFLTPEGSGPAAESKSAAETGSEV